MRNQVRCPAQQLRSVASRYREFCRAWQPLAGGAGRWRLAQKPAIDSAPLISEESHDEDRRLAMQRLEAVLLLAREPLNSRKLSQHANLADATEARTLIRQLNARYDERGRAFRIVDVAGGYQLLTRPQLASWLRRLEHTPSEVRLSAPALETLAVIAYRQPVGRADIEAIRGVNCGEIVRQLMDRDLVRIGGRGEELGRPYLYATTKRFLQIFGLSSLDDLPRADVVRQAIVPQAKSDVDSRVVTTQSIEVNDKRSEEDHNVSVTTMAALTWEEELYGTPADALRSAPVLSDEDDDFEDDDVDDEDDDDDDLDDDLDDDEDDDLDEEDDEDLEDEEWEEVDDEDDLEEEDDLDDDEEDDDDWDDDDLDDDEEEEDDLDDEV